MIALLSGGVGLVVEGANMPTTPDGVGMFLAAGILFGPGKAANGGGVAVSGLEMAQNSQRIQWEREQVDEWLRTIMRAVHTQIRETCEEYGLGDNYVAGANIAGFRKVADAMLDEAVV
jgi:glutamate dehydrogenase (NADP+)